MVFFTKIVLKGHFSPILIWNNEMPRVYLGGKHARFCDRDALFQTRNRVKGSICRSNTMLVEPFPLSITNCLTVKTSEVRTWGKRRYRLSHRENNSTFLFQEVYFQKKCEMWSRKPLPCLTKLTRLSWTTGYWVSGNECRDTNQHLRQFLREQAPGLNIEHDIYNLTVNNNW